MKKLRVDVEDIAICMENQARSESSYYLDTETGKTLLIPEEVMSAVEDDEFRTNLPEWERELLPAAKEIVDGSSRYVEVPARFSSEAHEVMADFAAGVKSARMREGLESAIRGKGAFSRFRHFLRGQPNLEKEVATKDRDEAAGDGHRPFCGLNRFE